MNSLDRLLHRYNPIRYWSERSHPVFVEEFNEQLLQEIDRPALEVGCGEGRVLKMTDAVGVDFVFRNCLVAKQFGDIVCAEASHLPFRGTAFKTAYTNEVLMHIEDIAPVVAEMKRTAGKTVCCENLYARRGLAMHCFWHDYSQYGVDKVIHG